MNSNVLRACGLLGDPEGPAARCRRLLLRLPVGAAFAARDEALELHGAQVIFFAQSMALLAQNTGGCCDIAPWPVPRALEANYDKKDWFHAICGADDLAQPPGPATPRMSGRQAVAAVLTWSPASRAYRGAPTALHSIRGLYTLPHFTATHLQVPQSTAL